MIDDAEIHRSRLLVVDDSNANIQLLLRLLHGAGYVSVASTQDPGAVQELHRLHRYDLILLDIQMPGIDGFEVMKRLKLLEPDGYLPVLAITANAAHKLHALQAGARDFVGKPFDLAEVLMRVRNLLEVRLLHQSLREHGQRLEALALHDALTGLANRRLLTERLAVALAHARRSGNAMAVVYFDLDGFKAVNDTHGHATGDVLLQMVAERFRRSVREEDTVARLGGDEFLLLMDHVEGIDHATLLATKLIEAIAAPYAIADQAVTITASAGIGMYPQHGADGDALMKSADRALFAAKHAGKNTVRIADPAAPVPASVKAPA